MVDLKATAEGATSIRFPNSKKTYKGQQVIHPWIHPCTVLMGPSHLLSYIFLTSYVAPFDVVIAGLMCDA